MSEEVQENTETPESVSTESEGRVDPEGQTQAETPSEDDPEATEADGDSTEGSEDSEESSEPEDDDDDASDKSLAERLQKANNEAAERRVKLRETTRELKSLKEERDALQEKYETFTRNVVKDRFGFDDEVMDKVLAGKVGDELVEAANVLAAHSGVASPSNYVFGNGSTNANGLEGMSAIDIARKFSGR